MILLQSGFSIPELFLIIAVLNAIVAVYIFSLLPEFLMRFLAWIVISVVYRIRPGGLDNIPVKGPAIVVCNHVSYIDPIILDRIRTSTNALCHVVQNFPDSHSQLHFQEHEGDSYSGSA